MTAASIASNVWGKTKTGGKAGFDKLWEWSDKLGAPVNRLSNKLGSEAFWPTTLDKESDKAARILKSFCKDGFYAEEKADPNERPQEGVPRGKQRVLKKIPTEVIQNAKGLAIFTTMRTGLWISGAGGSGVLVGRLPDGSWSPPSGILLHTAGLGFLVGVDIYDCVIVINTYEALEAFTKIRCTLGGEMSAVAGPVGMGGVVDSEVHKRRAPVFTYLKSRGFYAGVQVDGTVIIERTDENEKFYRQRIPVGDILKGKVRHPPREIATLMNTIRSAEGQMVEEDLLPQEAPPGDFELEEPGHVFGIPDEEDPDPYGFVALQKEGLDIREAGTKERASQDEFNFRPSPTSPVHTVYNNRRSMDSLNRADSSRRNSWRISALSTASRMTDSATQTDTEDTETRSPQSATFPLGDHPLHRRDSRSPAGSSGHRSMTEIPEHKESPRPLGPPPALPPRRTLPTSPPPPQSDVEDDEDGDADGEEDVVVHKVQTASAPGSAGGIQVVSKPRLVTVHKVAPPRLPPRNPGRDRRRLDAAVGSDVPISPISTTSSVGVGAERRAEESSETGSGQTRAESMSSFSEAKGSPDINNTHEKEREIVEDLQEVDLGKDAWKDAKSESPRRDDGFQDVDLSKPDEPVKKVQEQEAQPRMSGEMSSFAARLRMDDDDEEGEEPERKAPGAW